MRFSTLFIPIVFKLWVLFPVKGFFLHFFQNKDPKLLFYLSLNYLVFHYLILYFLILYFLILYFLILYFLILYFLILRYLILQFEGIIY